MANGSVRSAMVVIERYRQLGRRHGVTSFAIQRPDGEIHHIGNAPPRFTIVMHDARGAKALAGSDLLAVAVAYLNGWLDVTGDMLSALSIQKFFHDWHPMAYAGRFIQPVLRGQIATDRRLISSHYDIAAEFFLTFMDSRHRCYSHAVYESADQSLEDAMTHKMDLAIKAIGVGPGDSVLEVGGGWGAFAEHAARQGIHVTTLTISSESERFMSNLFAEQNLPVEVVQQHLFE